MKYHFRTQKSSWVTISQCGIGMIYLQVLDRWGILVQLTQVGAVRVSGTLRAPPTKTVVR